MTVVSRDIIDELGNLDRDPRTAQWWTTGVVVVPSICVAYLVATTALPLIMSSRKTKLPIGFIATIYNALMIVSHLTVGSLLFLTYQKSQRSYVCQDRVLDDDQISQSLLYLMWIYFALKVATMFDALILLSSVNKETRVTNATVLNGHISVSYMWWFLRYGADGHGVPSVIALCFVDTVTYLYFMCSLLGADVISVLRPHRVQVTRLQLIGTGFACAHYFIALIAECQFPSLLALIGFSFTAMRFVRLFDFYTEKFVLNGVRLGLDWSIIAGILENCCFAQGNPNGQPDDEDDYVTSPSKTTSSSSEFRNGFSGPINKPKRG